MKINEPYSVWQDNFKGSIENNQQMAYRKNGTQDPMRTQGPMRTQDPRRTKDLRKNQDPRRNQDHRRTQDPVRTNLP